MQSFSWGKDKESLAALVGPGYGLVLHCFGEYVLFERKGGMISEQREKVSNVVKFTDCPYIRSRFINLGWLKYLKKMR